MDNIVVLLHTLPTYDFYLDELTNYFLPNHLQILTILPILIHIDLDIREVECVDLILERIHDVMLPIPYLFSRQLLHSH